MIEYPGDEQTLAQAKEHGIPEEVLVRDLVRLVEVLNLGEKDFFGTDSVLSGSMALRCFNSPRFTVYDADFATSVEAQRGRIEMRDLLTYADDELEISPSELVPHDLNGTAWKSEPISYDPIFTDLAPNATERKFKADISSRGLLLPGQETELRVPYDLGLWVEAPRVWIMDPHEIVAEKVLGWTVHKLVKHYADLAFIAIVSQSGKQRLIELDDERLRVTLAAKLEAMRAIQPDQYRGLPSLDSVVDLLAERPSFDAAQWEQMVYLRGARDRFDRSLLVRAVGELLVPRFR